MAENGSQKELPRLMLVGASGQLGYDVSRVFAPFYEVVGFSSRELDLARPETVAGTVLDLRPEVIVNAAAHTRVDDCENEVEKAFLINAEGPARLAAAAAECGSRLVQISTDYVFAGDRRLPDGYCEADPVGPVSVYGRSKLAGEEAAARAGCRLTIVRTAWLYGIHGRNFLKTMLRLALADPEREIRVVDDQVGCPTWSETLARQLRVLVEADAEGIFHAVAGEATTWYGLARAFLELMQVEHRLAPCTSAEYPTPARRPANSILLNRRLAEENLLVMRPWREDLAVFVGRYREKLLEEARAELGKQHV